MRGNRQVPSHERIRAFFGLALPEPHRQALGPFLAHCAEVAPQFRWVPSGNLHLTIRFLGHLDLSVARGIARAVEDGRPAGFDVQVEGLDTFKRGRLVRVVWLGLAAGGEPAGALAAAVEQRCRESGLDPETRAFSAHLTLARARDRDGAPLPDLGPPPELAPWRAAELVLYRSHTGRGGSVYEPLETIRLS